jgi:hypothetical protein
LDLDGLSVPGAGKKGQNFACDPASLSDHIANSKVCVHLGLFRSGDSGGDADGGKSDAHYANKLGGAK